MRITVRENYEGETAEKIEALKRHYGIKQATSLLRLLITNEYQRVFGGPRLTHYNVYEDHITINDNQLRRLVDVYLRGSKARPLFFCSIDGTEDCIHVDFAKTIYKEHRERAE